MSMHDPEPKALERRVERACCVRIPPGSRVICGVSGGPDSMAMLHALWSVGRREQRAWRLQVAHLDHRLRPESAEDAAFVRRAAERLGLACTVASADVAAEAIAAGASIEETGRRLRYAFFERVAEQADAGSAGALVAVAHHADDQAETVLHRILRGTGLRGLRGMPAERPIRPGSAVRIVRPLLGLWRREIEAYIRHHEIEVRRDGTNATHCATRNRIRNALLPLIVENINPSAARALLRLARQAAEADDALRVAAGAALNEAAIARAEAPGGGEGASTESADAAASTRQGRRFVVLSAPLLARLPAAIRKAALLEALRRLGAGVGEIGMERVAAAAALVEADGARRTIELAGARIIRRGDELRVETLSPGAAGSTAREPIRRRVEPAR